MHPIVLAITGASGAIYAVRLLEVLLAAGGRCYLSISPAGKAVLETELGINVDLERFSAAHHSPCQAGDGSPGKLQYCHHQDLMAPIASGSFLTDGDGGLPVLRQHAGGDCAFDGE